MSHNPGLVDFNIGVVIFVLNLPDGQSEIFYGIQITKELLSTLLINGPVKITKPTYIYSNSTPNDKECKI